MWLCSSEAAGIRYSVNINIAPIYGSDKKCFLIDASNLTNVYSTIKLCFARTNIKTVNDPIAQNTIFGSEVLGKMKIKAHAFYQFNSFRASLSCENNFDQALKRSGEFEIVWRESFDLPLQDYQLSTVTYGTASASFLSTRCLQPIAKDCKFEHTEISLIMKNNFYVDNCLSGSRHLRIAIQTVNKLSDMLHKHCFHLLKWRSNSTTLPHHYSSVIEPDNLEINIDDCAKTLGIFWGSKQGHFKLKKSFKCEKEITKRIFLSQTEYLFLVIFQIKELSELLDKETNTYSYKLYLNLRAV
ncbi:uncharacterized protein NPIL_448451 [Nephila pilipes]|uniref:Uncharacterized protein n=1 Tax=Nephila pilipes TaxID=299642 RepID=A0A8X6TEC8_NEPPI|nr:uncharacterized protein NPIL_448451 [Nephila pilipes]